MINPVSAHDPGFTHEVENRIASDTSDINPFATSNITVGLQISEHPEVDSVGI